MELKQSGYFLARTLSYEASVLLCRPATPVPMNFAYQLLCISAPDSCLCMLHSPSLQGW